MTLGGRWRGARPLPTSVPRRNSRAASTPGCITESFTHADSTSVFGADLTWVQASLYGRDVHGTQYSGSAPYYFPAGTKSNAAALYQPNFSAPSGKAWGGAGFAARASDNAASQDMVVSATIPAVGTYATGGFATQGWYLFARCEDNGTNWSAHVPTGWQFEVSDGYFALYCNSVASNSETVIDTSSPPTISPGSVITLQVTGSMAGSDTHVIAKIDGTTVFDEDSAAITTALTSTSINPATELPEDTTGGFGFYAASFQPPGPVDAESWATNGLDGLTKLDSFSICA